MSFLEALKTEANKTTTLNGAVAHGTSQDSCLDLFAMAGGMRYRKAQALIEMFDRAYIENPELAMKLLFYIRDIRGGMGERKIFRTLLRHTAKMWTESVKKNIHLIPEYGRWDDLFCLLDTPLQNEMIHLVKEQLEKDLLAVKCREQGEVDATVSLLAKWMPSCNTSSKRTQELAKTLCLALEMSEKNYRKMLSKLRLHSCLTENYLSKKQYHKIQYETVPAGAMLKYRDAFATRDVVGFTRYLDEVSAGEKKMHSDTLFPYEIIRPYFGKETSIYGWLPSSLEKGDRVLDALWDSQKVENAQKNAISVIDTSGSMYWRTGQGPLPAMISQALGIRFAEHCKGPFHNHFITFESNPRLMAIRGNTLREKLLYLSNAPWGGSTNLEAVFDLILQTGLNYNLKQEEMPEVLYIISDMEFDCAIRNPNQSIFDGAKEMFEFYGYEMPVVVFHNVNSWQNQVPVTAHTKGTALVSGAGTTSFKETFNKNTTPMSHMLKVLNGPRYKEVHA